MLIRHPNSARGNDLYETPQAAMQTAFSAVEDEVAESHPIQVGKPPVTNKLDTLPARIMQLLVVAFSASASEGERLQALLGVDRHLKSVGSDGHDLIDRIKLSDKDNLKQVFDAGRAIGREEEIEQRQRSHVAVASLADNGDAATGYGGFTWREIVGHMLLNKQHINNGWEVRFVVSAARQLSDPSYELSAKQMPIVCRIFQDWFNGKL